MFQIDVIIPAYNESKRIIPTINKLKKHSAIDKIFVVDDGSTDNTIKVARQRGAIVIQNGCNMGKGYSVRNGLREALLQSKSKYFLVYDADGSSNLEGVMDYFSFGLMVPKQDWPSLCITSRERTGSRVVNDKLTRKISSKVFRQLVVNMLGLRYGDTQNGAVFFHKDFAKRFVEKGSVNGFCYTLDYLMLAKKEGYSVRVIPVLFTDTKDSRVKVIRDSIKMFKEILQVKRKWKR